MTNMRWTAKLRTIERAFDGLPPEPSLTAQRVRRDVERRTRELREHRARTLGTWARVLLIAVLAAAICFWPYPHACGAGLAGYLGAAAMVIAGGVWSAIWTWRVHIGLPHALALGVVLLGVALVGAQVLPRVGYTKAPAPQTATWWCAGSP